MKQLTEEEKRVVDEKYSEFSKEIEKLEQSTFNRFMSGVKKDFTLKEKVDPKSKDDYKQEAIFSALGKLLDMVSKAGQSEAYARIGYSADPNEMKNIPPIFKSLSQDKEVFNDGLKKVVGRSLNEQSPVTYADQLCEQGANAFVNYLRHYLKDGYGVSFDGKNYVTNEEDIKKQLKDVLLSAFGKSYNNAIGIVNEKPKTLWNMWTKLCEKIFEKLGLKQREDLMVAVGKIDAGR